MPYCKYLFSENCIVNILSYTPYFIAYIMIYLTILLRLDIYIVSPLKIILSEVATNVMAQLSECSDFNIIFFINLFLH